MPTLPSMSAINKAGSLLSSPTIIIEVQGLRVLTQHWVAVADATMDLTAQVLQVMGIYQVSLARSWLASNRNKAGQPNIRTTALYGSIRASEHGRNADVFWNGNDFWVDVSAGGRDLVTGEIPDARAVFLEFGFMHPSAGFVQYPYMMPALNVTEKAFERAMIGVATIPDRFPTFTGVGATHLNSSLTKHRAFLYSVSKALGDVQVFVGSPFLGKIRTVSLKTARGLGDFDSVMRGAIATRIQSRVTGRMMGAGLSTSRTVTMNGPPTDFSSGANRIYNRLAGKGAGLGMRELSIGRM